MNNGMPARTKNRTEQVDAMKAMFDAFEVVEFQQHCRIIDPPRAVVHWRGKSRARNGWLMNMPSASVVGCANGR